MKPIPKRLLPHNCSYKEYLGNDGEGDKWKTAEEIKFVKIEEKLQLKVTSNGREIVANARMFYDLISSTGFNRKPIENSKILFNQREYEIVEVDSLCADSETPHHYEILLK